MKFNYEIKNVDTTNKVMEVEFTTENEDPVLVSMEIPRVGADIREVMAAYAPVPYWKQKNATVQAVSVGETGEVYADHPTETKAEYDARIAAEEAAAAAQEASEHQEAQAIVE